MELKSIIEAILFNAQKPLSPKELRDVFSQTADASEEPLAKSFKKVKDEELVALLAPRFARWWLPDAVEFVDAIPRTSTGKFLKMALRERFRDRYRGRPDA